MGYQIHPQDMQNSILIHLGPSGSSGWRKARRCRGWQKAASWRPVSIFSRIFRLFDRVFKGENGVVGTSAVKYESFFCIQRFRISRVFENRSAGGEVTAFQSQRVKTAYSSGSIDENRHGHLATLKKSTIRPSRRPKVDDFRTIYSSIEKPTK